MARAQSRRYDAATRLGALRGRGGFGGAVSEGFVLILAPGACRYVFVKGLVIGLIKGVKGLIIGLVHTGRQGFILGRR